MTNLANVLGIDQMRVLEKTVRDALSIARQHARAEMHFEEMCEKEDAHASTLKDQELFVAELSSTLHALRLSLIKDWGLSLVR